MLTSLSASISSLTLNPHSPRNNALSSSSFNGLRLRLPAPPMALCRVRPRSTAVMMRKREEELKEIRTKFTEEINEDVLELKSELFMLRLMRSARNEFKSSEFPRMHKRIARMLTVKRERKIEEGINKRTSRKLDRQWKKSIVLKPSSCERKRQLKKLRSLPERLLNDLAFYFGLIFLSRWLCELLLYLFLVVVCSSF